MQHKPEVIIRNARAADAPAMVLLLDELGFPAGADVTASRLEAMDRAGETVLVAELDGAAVGFASVHVTPVLHRPHPVGRVTALVVCSRVRGTGIGRALVDASERLLAARGCGLVEITSNHRLTGAHAFYQHLGYTETSRRFKKDLVPERSRDA